MSLYENMKKSLKGHEACHNRSTGIPLTFRAFVRCRTDSGLDEGFILPITICKDAENTLNVLVEGTRAMQVEKLLKERDITYAVTTTDTTLMDGWGSGNIKGSRKVVTPRNISPLRSPVASKKQIMDWRNFYPLNVIYNFLSNLEMQYPAKCTVHVIGTSVEGRDIKMLKISNSDAKNPGVWIDGTTHAREWTSTAVATYIADYIANNFHKLPTHVTNKDWYIVPVVNPDGYVHTHTADRMWRKNRARHKNLVVGVDLNRNFGPHSSTSTDNNSTDPHHINYRGPEPFSEPETAAVKDVILYSGIPFKIFITLHAHSEVIAFPWCSKSDPCPDYVKLLEGGTVMSKAIFSTTGRMYKVGAFKDVMYRADGTSIDWSYGVAHIPYPYLIELRSKEHKFVLPKEEITDACREVLNGVLALADFVDRQTLVSKFRDRK